MARSRFFLRHARTFAGIALLVVSLSGCVPAAILVGTTIGGAVVYDKRSFTTMMHDQVAEKDAGQLLRNSPKLQQGAHIVLATFNHVMLMVGQTETKAQRLTAAQLVSTVKNVSRVYNEITIQKPTSKDQRMHDAWITTKLKADMLTTSGLHSTQIKVVTENSVVYLMGVLSPREVGIATKVARHVTGVREVVKVFENPS